MRKEKLASETKVNIYISELNEMMADSWETGFKCGWNKGKDDFHSEVRYAQSLQEQNNDLIKEIETLRNDFDDCRTELERYKAIVDALTSKDEKMITERD